MRGLASVRKAVPPEGRRVKSEEMPSARSEQTGLKNLQKRNRFIPLLSSAAFSWCYSPTPPTVYELHCG